MAIPYLTQLREKTDLSYFEELVLESVGVRSSEDLLSLCWNFPHLGETGLDLSKLSFLANLSTPKASFVKAVQNFGLGHAPPPRFAHGAKIPSNIPLQPGYRVPMPAPTGGGPTPPPVYPKLDFRFPNWPVKDQGARGTCVAFSMVACREHLVQSTSSLRDLSEQYLFWAIKTLTSDPSPKDDGTWIEFARDALSSDGTCLSSFWPYAGAILSGTVTHQTPADPSGTAKLDAPNWRHSAAVYQADTSTSGKTANVINAMVMAQRPVAVSLPVFGNPFQAGADNWNTAVGIAYGRVLDPPPTTVVIGGHAVCIVGFEPDPSEPKGGWFILRNSWGTLAWANSLPAAPPYFAPEVGYGQISATYVDKYLMEMCVL